MTTALILGAHGQIARHTQSQLLKQSPTIHQRLFLRNAARLAISEPAVQTVIEGNVLDVPVLEHAMANVDVVYANLGGRDIEAQAKAVVAAMQATGVRRLIWISTLGIYDEVPGAFGKWNHRMLDDGYLPTYTAAAKVIEDSDLDYTIIRPAWLSNMDVIDYELTQKGEPFKGTEVSRKSVGALVADLISHPKKAVKASLGVNQPNTDGAKPSFY